MNARIIASEASLLVIQMEPPVYIFIYIYIYIYIYTTDRFGSQVALCYAQT